MLVATRHPLAPLVAAVGGISLVAGFSTAHWLPDWSSLSDPVWEIGSWTWFSYAASTLEIVSSAAVALAGLVVLRATSPGRASREPETSLSSS